MKKQRTKKIWLIIGVITTIIIVAGGIMMFKWRSEEEIRNWKYETSLVEALKNSYSGIKEIEISNPEYSDKPSDSWGADIKLSFEDGTTITHVLAYNIETREIRIGVYTEEDANIEKILNSKKGITSNTVKVTYSDGDKGER